MAVARRRPARLNQRPARRDPAPRRVALALIAAGTVAAALGYAAAIARRDTAAAWGLTLASGWLVAGFFALGLAGARPRLGPWWLVAVLAGGCASVPFAVALLRPGGAWLGAPIATWGILLGTGLLPALILPIAHAWPRPAASPTADGVSPRGADGPTSP